MTKFREVRLQASHYWEVFTGRKCRLDGDIIADAYECDWQCDHRIPNLRNKPKTQAHISIFCSLGEWASCLTQQLLDDRFDEKNLTNTNDLTSLYLHYNQILLVISEILVDFTDLYKDAMSGKANIKSARKYLSNMDSWILNIDGNSVVDGYDIDHLQNFINHIVKHKVGDKGNLHCYHHLKIKFEDKPGSRHNKSCIRVGNWNPNPATSIHMPSLVRLVMTIIACYIRTNELLRDDNAFNRVIDKYKNDD